MKTCSVCQTEKPFTDFHKRASAKDGHQPQCKQCRREWAERDHEKNTARQREWYAANPGYNKKWREANPERYAAHKKKMMEWQRNNRDKVSMYEKAVRARRMEAMIEPIPVSDSFIKRFYGNRCLHSDCSATTRLELDHVIPLNIGGAHTLENLQVLCKHHNASKGDRSCADYRTVKLVAVDPVSMTIICQAG